MDTTNERPRWPRQVVGGKYVRHLDRLLRALRPADAHGNRRLYLDDVLICYLLAFFNPVLRSLRTVEDFSRTTQAARHLSVDRIPRSTLSDFNRVADATLLEPIVGVLRQAVARAPTRRGRVGGGGEREGLPEELGRVLAVDGSFFSVATDVAWAFKRRGGQSRKGGRPRRGVRLDAHVDVATWLPEVISISAGESEAEHAASAIVKGAVHVYDRGIFSFELVAAHAEKSAHFVHRLREPGERTPRFVADEERPIDADGKAASVISDRLGRLAGSTHREPPACRYREVVIKGDGEQVRLLTDLLDLPAHVIGAIYRHRWQVELFFRWLKSCAQFRSAWCETREGVLLQFYVALIATLLVYLYTGMRPSKYVMNLMGMVVNGSATWEEIRPIIEDRDRERELDRQRLARKRAGPKP